MKRFLFLLAILTFPFLGGAQITYKTGGGEIIFGFADLIDNSGEDLSEGVRTSLFFHLSQYRHLDLNNNFGWFTGLGLRNIGFVAQEGVEKVKYRVYTVGVPLGVKLGNFRKRTFVFGGVEGEFAFNYKEKRYVNGKKTSKYTAWFSDRTEKFLPSAFAGIQFGEGLNVKFRVYLDDFMKGDYQESNLFHFSLSYQLEYGKRKIGKNKPSEL
jgi:hypothetical protein